MEVSRDKPTIVFFGNERLATGVTTTAPTLQALIEAGYNVAAVVSHYERSKSRNARDLEIAAVAERHNIPVLLPEKPADIIDQLKSYSAVVGVIVAYGKIVPQSVIDIFPRGIVNIHPSMLPLHRGPIPLESVMLNGATETGVSVMKLVKAMDAGPVYDQTKVQLTGDETKQELADLLIGQGKNILVEILPEIIDGSAEAWEQDESVATYDALLRKEDGKLDFTKPAVQLEREIRAYAEWPKSQTTLASKEVTVTKAHPLPTNFGEPGDVQVDDNTALLVQTSEGVLSIDSLKPAGKNEMTVSQFLAGYSQFL